MLRIFEPEHNQLNEVVGFLQYCLNSQWSAVCPWDTTQAEIACKQLGYSDQGESIVNIEKGIITTLIIYTQVQELELIVFPMLIHTSHWMLDTLDLSLISFREQEQRRAHASVWMMIVKIYMHD